MARANQGGSVLGFVVVAIVLAGLLIGGVYALRRLTAQPEAVAVSQKPSQSTQKQPEKKEPKKTSNSSSNKKESSSQSKAESQPPTSTANQLPQTGPESLFGTLVALAALSGAAVSYARSRRPELSL